MSSKHEQKRDEGGRDEQRSAPAQPPMPKASADDEAAPRIQGLKYEFKIAPADPKNSFDFEDVADK